MSRPLDPQSVPRYRLSALAPEFVQSSNLHMTSQQIVGSDSTIVASPAASTSLNHSQITCKYFAAGNCTRGDSCWFKHDSSTRTRRSMNTNGAVPASQSTAAASSRNGNPDDPCAICFDKPQTYGLMTGCDHVFCLDCIRKWRSSSTKGSVPATSNDPYDNPTALASTSKTCPLCRVRTRYVIPSIIFPKPHDDGSANTQKEEIERVYLLRLSKIPCRYFTASLVPKDPHTEGSRGKHPRNHSSPWCPFGNECHYLHEKDGQQYKFSKAQLSREMWNHRASARRRNINGGGSLRLDPVFIPTWVINREIENAFEALGNIESDDEDDEDDEDLDDLDIEDFDHDIAIDAFIDDFGYHSDWVDSSDFSPW